MQKISGILPSSARVSSVDMKEAAPIRPGTPSFGRPEGVSSLRDRALAEAAATKNAVREQNEMMHWRAKEGQQADLVQTLSNKFFMKNMQDAARPESMGEIVKAPYNPNAVETTSFDSDALEPALPDADRAPIALTASSDSDTTEDSMPTDVYPKGSFIDFVA